MTKSERELLDNAIAETELLKVEVAALQELVIALAIALTEKPNPSLDDTARKMESIRKLTRLTKGNDVAQAMKQVTDYLLAVSDQNPTVVQIAMALMHLQAGDAKREALSHWLAQATPDEIEGDIFQTLRLLLPQDKQSGELRRGGDETQDDV